MDRTKALTAVNVLLFVAVSIQVISGLILFLAGSRAAYRIHKYNAVFFPVTVIAHVALNWGWIKSVARKTLSEK